MTWTAVGANPAGSLHNVATTSLTTHNVGNLIVVLNSCHSASGAGSFTDYPVSMSDSGNLVSWAVVPGTNNSFFGFNNVWYNGNIWLGTVTGIGTTTVTVGYTNGNTEAFTNMTMLEFHSSVGSWHVDTWTWLNSSGTSTWPSLTATGSGELYFGYAYNSGSSTGGPSTPWVVNNNADGASNGSAYNLSYTSGTSPVFSDSSSVWGPMVLIAEGPAGVTYNVTLVPRTWTQVF